MNLTESSNIFFEELHKSLDKIDATEDDICLISFEQLKEPIIKLDCGHKFNYGPIYNDVFNQKNKFNSMEGFRTMVPKDKMRCPYCRNINKNILPYFENFGYEKEPYINWIPGKLPNGYAKRKHLYNNCSGSYKYSDNLFVPCNQMGTQIKAKKYNNKNYFCEFHKQKFKDEFNIELKKIKSNKFTNILPIKSCVPCNLNSSYKTNGELKCEHILIKGKNKGNKCSKKIYSGSLCKQHFIKASEN